MGQLIRNGIGYLLILLGVLFALSTFDIISFSMHLLWPLFILIPALMFHGWYFMNPSRENTGLLVPGGILLTVSLLFFINNIFGGDAISVLWPVFILAPAVGLFEMYFFGDRNPSLLIPIGVLTTVGVVFLGLNLLSNMFGGVFGLLLVIVGLVVIFSQKNSDKKRFF